MATEGVGLNIPATLDSMNVDVGLRQKRWNDNKLFMESLQPDPLFNSAELTHVVEVGPGSNVIQFYDSIFIDCTPKDEKGKAARSITMAFVKSLDMDPLMGNNASTGTQTIMGSSSEGTLEMKYYSAFANDWAGAIVQETFGIDYRELSPYGVYEQIRPLMGQWLGEVRGYFARYALCQNISPNLAVDPIGLTAGINPCVYIPGQTAPAYDSTAATYLDHVGAGLATAGATALLDVPEILELVDHAAAVRYIEPVTIGGQKLYVLLVGRDQYRRLNDPSVSYSWRSMLQQVLLTSDVAKSVPGAKMIIDDSIVIVRDPRAPQVNLGGTASNYTLTFQYSKYGRKDDRSGAKTTANFDVNILLGRGALWKYEPEMPHYENQPDVFGRYKSNGLFGAVGYGVPIWDLDAAQQDDSSAQQESSMLVLTSRV